MEYFNILNLIREPFSNSPEPEFFYQSPKHIHCLQQLELAIRLRRGLNVVLGHVGTGKTTLCRRLITQFAEADPASDAVETHLLMDPAFTTPAEFLRAVALAFGISARPKRKSSADAETSDWQLKENIKDYLLTRGVHEKRIVALIIDEGQNLPDFCLEILREFLNYETNENKLLQIVIFAQKEFRRTLDRIENFADRVNLLYLLEPLNFQETREMIRFRIAQAGEPGNVPELFSQAGFRAVYRATGGYPRKIITLCHQVVLSLIIQNRTRAGWFLVRSCAGRMASAGQPSGAWRLRWVPGILIALLAGITFVFARPVQTGPVRQPEATRQEVPAQAVHKTETVLHPQPASLGKLVLKDGRTIWRMLTDLYGTHNEGVFRSVALANPHIRNLGRVNAGETIHLPALPAAGSPLPADKYTVQLAASANLEHTYELYRTYQTALPELRFLPYWNPRQGMVFSIILKDGYPDEASARQSITRFPAALASGAGVLKDMGRDTVFYTR
jgi:general secretion pathway protein A